MSEIKLSDKYKLLILEKPEEEVVELLKSTLWGTNGPLFIHKDTADRIMSLNAPVFFSLKKQGETIATCTFSNRMISVNGRQYNSWYARYFSIDKQHQGKIFGNILLKNIRKYFEEHTDKPTVFYAYVDQANPRSYKLLEKTGFKSIRSFETIAFSRIFPKADARVSGIREEEKAQLTELLRDQYREHALVNFDKLFFRGNYFVLKADNKIVAGVQANVVHWAIKHLPGISGKLIISVLPHLPLVSRLFNPDHFNFLSFEGLYCRKGYEKELFTLMESVCALRGMYTAMLWMDTDSELYQRIRNAGDWGIMNKVKKSVKADIVAAFKNIPEDEQKTFSVHPAYISAFDMT